MFCSLVWPFATWLFHCSPSLHPRSPFHLLWTCLSKTSCSSMLPSFSSIWFHPYPTLKLSLSPILHILLVHTEGLLLWGTYGEHPSLVMRRWTSSFRWFINTNFCSPFGNNRDQYNLQRDTVKNLALSIPCQRVKCVWINLFHNFLLHHHSLPNFLDAPFPQWATSVSCRSQIKVEHE